VTKAHAGPLTPDAVWAGLKGIGGGLPARFVQHAPTPPTSTTVVRKLLGDLDAAVGDAVARLTFLARVGPMLGLMGTLIPLGPALTGLGSGDIQQLSANLVLAFSTTVVGLVIASAAYGMGVCRRSWYARDLDDLTYLLEAAYGPALAAPPPPEAGLAT
jgi:biopolymer transport protein ExbB/TolQ